MRCLIVEDDDSAREMVERILIRGGHRVLSAGSLIGAQDALAQGPVDVILLDLDLPDSTGVNVVALVRDLAPGARILVVSGHAEPRHVMVALEAGADGYLLKDELSEDLSRALQAVRAGHAPLSPQVAAVALRRLRQQNESRAASPVARVLPSPTKRG
ncbi:MAG TPA: response regulator transcription factor [Kofleriaceae bacterium]|nr:response regulator transcription factor [Kofleriaceae bacterium]